MMVGEGLRYSASLQAPGGIAQAEGAQQDCAGEGDDGASHVVHGHSCQKRVQLCSAIHDPVVLTYQTQSEPMRPRFQEPRLLRTGREGDPHRAIVMLLEPLSEQDFLDCAYGFRPGRAPHQALEALRNAIRERNGRWILDLDISNYFGTIDQRQWRAALDQRVKDGLVRRRIDKGLKAGVREEGIRTVPDAGTPQGGVLSPLLAHVFLP